MIKEKVVKKEHYHTPPYCQEYTTVQHNKCIYDPEYNFRKSYIGKFRMETFAVAELLLQKGYHRSNYENVEVLTTTTL